MTTHMPTANYPRFHLAFPVTDLERARRFYGVLLGCAEGRASDEWVDFDFFGHQIEPYIRFKGLPGEQATMFFLDPFGNALEFKAFADIGLLFAADPDGRDCRDDPSGSFASALGHAPPGL